MRLIGRFFLGLIMATVALICLVLWSAVNRAGRE